RGGVRTLSWWDERAECSSKVIRVDDAQLAKEYLLNFLGYGDPRPGGIWFIGPEERGTGDVRGLFERAKAWNAVADGSPHLIDLAAFHRELSEPIVEDGGYQPTWAGIIHI